MDTGRDDERPDDAAEAVQVHILFREVNERIRGLNASFDAILPIGEWVCECADATCIGRLQMTFAEYEAIRAHPSRFAVLPGHEPRGEPIVERRPGYLVVERGAVTNLNGRGRTTPGHERVPSR